MTNLVTPSSLRGSSSQPQPNASQPTQRLFEGIQFSSPIKLVGASEFKEQYRQAKSLLQTHKAQANSVFLQILNKLPEPVKAMDLIFRAACHIGAALSSSADNKNIHATAARKDLDKAHDNAVWEEGKEVQIYQELRCNYTRLLKLTPENEIAALQEKIQECKAHIPPLVDFHEKLALADAEAQKKPINFEKTNKAYQEALRIVEGKEEDEFVIQRMLCTMKWALAIPASGRNDIALTIKPVLDQLFGKLEHFGTNEKNLELIPIFIAQFYLLISDANKQIYLNELKEKWDICVTKLKTLNPSREITEFPTTAEELQQRMQTPDDDLPTMTPKKRVLNLSASTPLNLEVVNLLDKPGFMTPEPNLLKTTPPPTPITRRTTSSNSSTDLNAPKAPQVSLTRKVSPEPPGRSNIYKIFAIFVLLAAAATVAVVYYRRHYEKID